MNALHLLGCYLLGAFPTGYLAGRLLKGVDIRTLGSGNVGATNVFRTVGRGPGVAVLLIDAAKGWLAVTALPAWTGAQGWWVLAGGLSAVLGHNYTCFLGFKGGKGVATSAGVVWGLAPLACLTALLCFILVLAATRTVSLGSLAAATLLPAAVWYHGEAGGPPPPGATFWLCVGLAAFVWIRHIPNIRRLLQGTEHRFEIKKR